MAKESEGEGERNVRRELLVSSEETLKTAIGVSSFPIVLIEPQVVRIFVTVDDYALYANDDRQISTAWGFDDSFTVWGATNGALPRPVVSVIFTERIREAGPPTFDRYTWDVLDLEATLYTISHEMGHAVNLRHHYTGTTNTCVMFHPQTSEWQAFWANIPNDYCVTNPSCRFLWFLKPP